MICLTREISVQLKYIRECFFSNTNRTNLTNLVGCDMVYIRGIREICGQLNIIHTLICFSNTNRTNLTNLVGCDPVCIRGIREICGQLNIIHTRMFFFEHESHESDESCKCVALALLRTIYICKITIYHRTITTTAAASGHACKSVRIPLHQKEDVKKNPWSKTPLHQ